MRQLWRVVAFGVVRLLAGGPAGGFALFSLWLLAASALARPGGGQSFGDGGGGGGSGGGGGGGGGEILFLLIRLVFIYPKVGVPLLIVGVIVLARMKKSGRLESWETGGTPSPAAMRRASPRATPSLASLRELDPDFSQVVFEDFAYRLYAAAHRARTDSRALSALAPYLSERVRQSLAQEAPAELSVSAVVVGAMRVDSVRLPAPGEEAGKVVVGLSYESNLTLGTAPHERTFYLREHWQLARDARARTKPPEQTEKLGCPNCGAPFESGDDRRCAYCGAVVADGRFGFQVTARRVLAREPRPPALTSDVMERGTSLPSVVAGDQQQAFQALCERDPALDASALESRLRLIYDTLNRAYTALDLTPARGLLSDGMFDYLRYWTEAYRAQGLRNVLERMHITRAERVKVVSDRYFDALTFRLWASGIDYTIDAKTRARVSGSETRERPYSEYWTLIRAAGHRGAVHTDATCPNCAAPLSVTMAGNCDYCSAHITRGEFDWVLSKIEQDESYVG